MLDPSSGLGSSLQSNHADMNQDPREPETTDDQIAQTKEQRKSYLGLDYARINAVGTNIPGF